ncbi:MAG TPA: substrate-binding domain-containing protein [Xanthobacteraceae bacterium]
MTRSMTRSMKLATMVAAALGAAMMATGARAAEITVIGSTAMTEFIEAVAPLFEHDSGHKVKASFLSGSALPVKVKEGVGADLIITTPETVDDLVKAGKLVAGSRLDFIRSSAGVAVRAGAPKPDISTPEAFKNALLAAKSVGISQGPSGIYMLSLLERLGILDAVKAKAIFTAPGQRVGLVIADGRAEIGVQQITELLAMKGIDYVGPLPPTLQTTIVYATARPTNAKETAAADTFAKFLTSKEVVPTARKMGLDPA